MNEAAPRGIAWELGRLGGFFAADVHLPDAEPGPGWRTLRAALADTERLDARIDTVRCALGAAASPPTATMVGGETVALQELRAARTAIRVAASVAHLGLVARLLAPALAVRALGLPPLALAPAQLWLQHDLSGAFALSCGTGGVPAPPGTAIVDTVEFFAARYRVPPRSLWGNVGSAANGAAAQLARQRPELRRHAWAVAAELLADRRVDGGRSVAGPGYRRRSCCLAFRVSGRAAACQDCVLGSAACLSR